MRRYVFGNTELFIADSWYKELEDRLEDDAEIFHCIQEQEAKELDVFLDKNPKIRRYVELYSKLTGLNRRAILKAHGGCENGRFVFYDEDKAKDVQQWLSRKDGKYLAIFVSVCNPESKALNMRKSLLFVPNKDYAPYAVSTGEVQVEMFDPRIGYVSSYLLDYELSRLEGLL